MKIIETKLSNKYKVNVIENSKYIIDEIWEDKIYETDFKIDKGMVIIDIGANQGFFSLYASSKGAKVYSIEPEKTNFKILKKNIINNNLQNQIKAFNYAVSTKKGQIEIFVMDYNNLNASGLVTTSNNYLKTININKNKINKIKVNCIRLDKFLDNINVNVIDLLKIDCEGAEIDILNSADKKYFAKINNLVMEIHGNYEEKDIFYLVKDLGFNILNFKKIDNVFKNGYLFAKNKILNKKGIVKPVIKLKYDPIIINNTNHCFDSSKSFSTTKKNNILNYFWFIDDKEIKNDNPILNYTFNNPGNHKIQLKIFDGENFNIETKELLVLKKSYFEKKDYVFLSKSEEHLKTEINNKKHFIIKKELFPKDWIPELIAVSIRFCNPKKRGCLFLFNNERIELNKNYNKIIIPNFPSKLDFIFSLESNIEKEIDITWWPDNIKKEIKKINIDNSDFKNKAVNVLPEKSIEYFFYSSEEDQFVIHRDYMRFDWNASYLVIGLTYCERGVYNGDFEFNGKKHTFSVNYKEIKLDINKIKSNFNFIIKTFIENKKFKIIWWAE